MQNKYLLRFVFLWWMNGCVAQNIQTINNCTCQLSNGSFYSLWPFRGVKKPFFIAVPGKKYPGWLYAYNPCTSLTFDQDDPYAKTLCHDIGICKYAEIEKPRKYHQVGVQTGVRCALNKEGQIELVYKTKDKAIDPPYSTVQLICDEAALFPSFEPKDEDNYIFTLTTKCACPDQCWPPTPEPTIDSIPGPMTTSNSTIPTPKDSKSFKWKLHIFIPSLSVILVIMICCCCCWCLRRHIAAVKEALRYRCCRCFGEHQKPRPEVDSYEFEDTEKTKLMKPLPNDEAVEPEDFEGKNKLVKPVHQEEDMGDKTQTDGEYNVLSQVL